MEKTIVLIIDDNPEVVTTCSLNPSPMPEWLEEGTSDEKEDI